MIPNPFLHSLYFMFPKSRFLEVDMDIRRGCQDGIQILTSLLHFFLSNTTEEHLEIKLIHKSQTWSYAVVNWKMNGDFIFIF